MQLTGILRIIKKLRPEISNLLRNFLKQTCLFFTAEKKKHYVFNIHSPI